MLMQRKKFFESYSDDLLITIAKTSAQVFATLLLLSTSILCVACVKVYMRLIKWLNALIAEKK
jgi:hypothetical protein